MPAAHTSVRQRLRTTLLRWTRSRLPSRGRLTRGRVAMAVAAVAVAVLLPAQPAAAHAVLVSSDPINGASLSRAPAVVVLRFSEDLVATGSTARLVDAAGTPVAGARVAADSGPASGVDPPHAHARGRLVRRGVAGVRRVRRAPHRRHPGVHGRPRRYLAVRAGRRWTARRPPALAAARAPVRPRRRSGHGRACRGPGRGGRSGPAARRDGPAHAPPRARDRAPSARQAAAAGRHDRRPRPYPPTAWRLGQIAVCAAAVPVLLRLAGLLRGPSARYPLRGGWIVRRRAGRRRLLPEAADADAIDGPPLTVAASYLQVLAGCLVVGLVGLLAVLLWRPGLAGVQHGAVVRSVPTATGPVDGRRRRARDRRRPLRRRPRGGLAEPTAAHRGWGDAAGRGRTGTHRKCAGADLAPLGYTDGGGCRWWRAARTVPAAASGGARVRARAAGHRCGRGRRGRRRTSRAVASPSIRDGRSDDLVVSVSVVPNRPGPNGFTVEVASSRRPAPAPVEQVALSYPDGGSAAVPLADVGRGAVLRYRDPRSGRVRAAAGHGPQGRSRGVGTDSSGRCRSTADAGADRQPRPAGEPAGHRPADRCGCRRRLVVAAVPPTLAGRCLALRPRGLLVRGRGHTDARASRRRPRARGHREKASAVAEHE